MHIKRGTIPPRLGKRRRRALIRLRHALAAEKFNRWFTNGMRLGIRTPPHKAHPQAWHAWHALGCP